MKVRKIRITTTDSGRIWLRAYIVGAIGIHPAPRSDGSWRWNITHIRTGLAILKGFKSKRVAIGCAHVLNQQMDWGTIKSKRDTEACPEVVRVTRLLMKANSLEAIPQ